MREKCDRNVFEVVGENWKKKLLNVWFVKKKYFVILYVYINRWKVVEKMLMEIYL